MALNTNVQLLHSLHESLHKFILTKGPHNEDDVIVQLEEYFKQGYDVNAQIIDETCQGSTLLQVAAYCRCPKVVHWLLQHHADVNLRHLTHVGYNAFTITTTPTVTNKLVSSFEQRHAKVQTQTSTSSYVNLADNEQVKVLYEVLEVIANHAVAVQPACAFSLFTFLSLTDLSVMPPIALVTTVLELVSTSSSHFFILIDIIDFVVQLQNRFTPCDATASLETEVSSSSTTTVAVASGKKEAHTPSNYISINTLETRSQAQANFMHLFDILIYQLEKIPYKQQAMQNEHFKYQAVYRLLQDADLAHTSYPAGTDPQDASFVIPPHHRVRPVKDADRGTLRHKNTALSAPSDTCCAPTSGPEPEEPSPLPNTHSFSDHTHSSDDPLSEASTTLLSNTALPSGLDVTSFGATEQGEDRIRVKVPRNYYLPIFFLLRAAQPHLGTILFYVQRHYYGFMQEYVQHKFRQLELTRKLDRMSLVEFFQFLNQQGDLPHSDVPHDLEKFDKSLEEFQTKFAEREQLVGKDFGKLQMKLSSNAKQEPRIVDSYANYLLFKQILKFSYPYTPTTVAILELLFSVYDITGNTYLACCREKRQQKQRDQQLKKSDLKGYHSPDCQYFEYYCELLLTFTQYGRYRHKGIFTEELLTTVGQAFRGTTVPSNTQLLANTTKTQHDTVFLQIHALLSKSLTEISVLARRARLTPHIYSNLYIYGQHQTSTIRYVLAELRGEDRYHLQAQDLANLDYNIMSFIGNLGNVPGQVVPKSQAETYQPPTDRDLLDVIQNALGYFFELEANFFLNQADALAAAQEAEANPNKPIAVKSYTIDGGDVTTPIINPNGCYWRFTRVKECIGYLNSIEYFWHHMIRFVYHLVNNNAMNSEMLSIILGTVLEHGLKYRPRQIRAIVLSLIYNIPGYFQGQNAPSYPLLSAHIIKNVQSGNAVAAPVLTAPKVEPNLHLTTTRTNNSSTNSSTRSTRLSDDSSDDEMDDDKNSDYHYTTAAIGTSNAIISSVEQDRLRQVRFYIVNMADHATIIRNTIAFFAFVKSVHVKSPEVVQRELKDEKERRKRRKLKNNNAENEEDDEEDDEEELELFEDIEDEPSNPDDSEESISSKKPGQRRIELDGAQNGVVLKKQVPSGGRRFFIQFTSMELEFVNKFFNIPSSFECIPQFYRLYREFLCLYWSPTDDEWDLLDEQRLKDKHSDYLPIPPALQLTNDPRILVDKKRQIDASTLTTPCNIATLGHKSMVPGKNSLPKALNYLYPTPQSRIPLTIKCFEIELASYVVRYRDFLQYDPFSIIKDESYKIIINHLQQFQAHKYFCYPELVVNLTMMYFLAVGRLKWQQGKYKDLLNNNPLFAKTTPALNTTLDPRHYSYFSFAQQAQTWADRIQRENTWAEHVDLTEQQIGAIDVLRDALVQYIVFYCSDNHHRAGTMASVLSRLEHHLPDREKPNKKTKYRHHINSLYFPIMQANHPWFPLTNSLLNPYAGFFTIIDNVNFNVGAGTQTHGQNSNNTPYQHYSRQLRPDYVHIKTYTEFFEATAYDANNLHTQYLHYSQHNPLHHDNNSRLRYKFQFNRDYTWALHEMMSFFHSTQQTSFFAKLHFSKPQLTSFIMKPYSRLYLTKLLTTYKDFVQRDNISHHPADAMKYQIYYKNLIDVTTEGISPQRQQYVQQRDFLMNTDPGAFTIGKENKFNFDMYSRFVREAEAGPLNVVPKDVHKLMLPEKINSFNKHKLLDNLKCPPQASIHGSGKDKIAQTVKAAGDAACYSDQPWFTMREQDLLYNFVFQQVINYYSIGEFKHLAPIDIDVIVYMAQNVILQRRSGIAMKQQYLNLGHNFTPFSFDFTRILRSHLNMYTVKLFATLFDHQLVHFAPRQLNVALPPTICQQVNQRLPGQITLEELTHLRQQSTSTALYTAQRIPVFNSNLAHVDAPHHNMFNIAVAHQFFYDPIAHEPMYQLKLPTHALDHTPLTMYDHKFSNCMYLSLSHVDNLTSTQATRTFAAITSYMRQMSPVSQRNVIDCGNSSENTSNFYSHNQQAPVIQFLSTRQSSLLFDLLDMFFYQAGKTGYDPNIKHIIYNMLNKQTVVYNQLNVQVLEYLLHKNAQLNRSFINTVGNEVELLLVSQHLFWNPAQVHTVLFNRLFTLFFKRTHYRKLASIIHLNQLSRLCVITDILYHFRLPVYTHKRVEGGLLAFDITDVHQQQLSLHQYQMRERDHRDSRENLDRAVAIVQQYLQLFNFNAPTVSATTLRIIHDLLSMGRGFCASCQAQSIYTQQQRYQEQLKHTQQYIEDTRDTTASTIGGTSASALARRRQQHKGALVDTGEELVLISKNACSCQPILKAYRYFQGIIEGLIRSERFNFIKNSENHTWTARVTVGQALYDILFYYNMFEHNIQNTNARRYMNKLAEEGKELTLSTQHTNWIAGIQDLTQGEIHNLPKHPMPDVSGVTCFSFNNKYVNIVQALVNHPIDKIRTIFDVNKIYAGKTVNFDVEYIIPLPSDPAARPKPDQNVKNLSGISLLQFLQDWYNSTKPSEELIAQIHQLLTSFNNTTYGLLPNNTLYTAFDGTKGFFFYILNNVYQPSVDDLRALLPLDSNGLIGSDGKTTIFKSFINELNPDAPLLNNAKQSILANIFLRRWNREVLTYLFAHPQVFNNSVDHEHTCKHFAHKDMFNCTLADYLLSGNTFNYAFHLVRPYVLKYYEQDQEYQQ